MPKKLIAAFLWDSANKSMSFMLIDSNFKLLDRPRKYQLDNENFANFKSKAQEVIEIFFDQIKELYNHHKYKSVQIEYKILHHVKHELAYMYQPSLASQFVRKQFMHHYALTKAVILPMTLAKQLRVRLRRPQLDEFKKKMVELEIVAAKRKNTYQFHLWILATHATKTNYKQVLRRIGKNKFTTLSPSLSLH